MTSGEVLDWLRHEGSEDVRKGLKRYAIPTERALGIQMKTLKSKAREIGANHALALELWAAGWYEARTLAVFVDRPDCVTAEQMDAWAEEFDNWAICDTACFHLFDRTPCAWDKVQVWAAAPDEFVKRAAFALVWSLSVHDRRAGDEPFLAALEVIDAAADDGRNFVKKGVDMALRAVGKRNTALNEAALATAHHLAGSAQPTRRWIGRRAVRELDSDKVRARFTS